jgi:putative nucleotidyltransferase with HDIG domain
VGGVLTAAAMHRQLRVDQCLGFRFEAYWRHALGTALLARALGPRAGLNGDESFLAGLMHDVGALVLAAFHPQEAAEVIRLTRAADRPAHEVELVWLGLHHGTVGALVARHWRFPAAIADAIERHHEPAHATANAPMDLAQLVQLADALAHGLDLNGDVHEAVPLPSAESWLALGLDLDSGLSLLQQTADDVTSLSAALQAS